MKAAGKTLCRFVVHLRLMIRRVLLSLLARLARLLLVFAAEGSTKSTSPTMASSFTI